MIRYSYLLTILNGCLSFSCTHGRGHSDPHHQGKGEMMSLEMHEKMAKMHSDAAACLRQGTTKEKCQELMMNEHRHACEELGSEGCMGMGRVWKDELKKPR